MAYLHLNSRAALLRAEEAGSYEWHHWNYRLQELSGTFFVRNSMFPSHSETPRVLLEFKY